MFSPSSSSGSFGKIHMVLLSLLIMMPCRLLPHSPSPHNTGWLIRQSGIITRDSDCFSNGILTQPELNQNSLGIDIRNWEIIVSARFGKWAMWVRAGSSIYLSICLYTYLLTYLPMCASSTYLPTYLSIIHLPTSIDTIYLAIDTYLPIYRYNYISTYV